MSLSELEKRIIEEFDNFEKWCYSSIGPNNRAECNGGARTLKLRILESIKKTKCDEQGGLTIICPHQHCGKKIKLTIPFDLERIKEGFIVIERGSK